MFFLTESFPRAFYVIEIDLMEFCHSCRYPATDLRITKVCGSKSDGVKMLFYTTIIKSSIGEGTDFVLG